MTFVDIQAELWQEYVAEVCERLDTPFAEQWTRFTEIFAGRDVSLPPPPAWRPDPERRADSNLQRLMGEIGLDTYDDLHRWSSSHRAEFWQRVIDDLGIVFKRPPAPLTA